MNKSWPTSSPDSRFAREEERIRAAYARRSRDDRYSWFNPGYLFMMQEREKKVLRLLKRYGFDGLEDKKILDVGCGTGIWINDLVKWGARPEHITGVELLPERLILARQLCPAGVTLIAANAAHMEFTEATFDLVLQATMFTSILDDRLKQDVAAEMVRVLNPQGLILWYDYHVKNLGNPDVRGVKKSEIQRLFPECRIKLERLTLAPPLSRWLAPYSFWLCHLLARIPIFCTHYLGVIQKPWPESPAPARRR